MASINDTYWRRRTFEENQRRNQMFEQAFEYQFYVALPHGPDDWRKLVDYVKATLQGATIQSATGIWQGDQEYSIVITVVAHCRDNGRWCASMVAADLRQMFAQDCVMVTETPISRAFI